MVKTKIGVYGLGLIGGSIALRLAANYDVVGVDRSEATRAAARKRGLQVADSAAAFDGCAAVFVCVPVAATADCIRAVHAAVGETAVITDVAGIKGILSGLDVPRLVGGHPMAGTEHSGFGAAKPHLFENAYYPIVRYRASEADVATIETLVQALGARPIRMDADTHDRYVAEISHMPHLVAYALASVPDEAIGMAGTGFYDMTRIARSDPAFWTQILCANRDNVLHALDSLTDRLTEMRTALQTDAPDRLTALLHVGQTKRIRLEEDKLCLDTYTLYVDVVDRPGEVDRVVGKLYAAGINVKSLAIVHSREGVGGALRLEFALKADRDRAETLLL
ncbi:MAG: prephenate dehydrogenase/arogenate dehydrogenase family protein [Clostridia bacterium]|jgi:prephenate dehydrogenase|nr:prephenate dehydrogenase/arogenate dehydrogenase family protein [Clostridia bacterium]